MLKGNYFAVNVTPETGKPLAYDIQLAVDDPLYLKGFVFLSDKDPFVIGALDWIGISCESLDKLKNCIASAVQTKKECVQIHTTHFHDAPHSNLTAVNILKQYGWNDVVEQYYDVDLLDRLCVDVMPAVREAVRKAVPITHVGYGNAEVHEVASNRRITGEDGKIKHTRYSSCSDSHVRSLPEGLIDPYIDLITLWNHENCIASASYYATHPMSYYRTAMCSSDFVGMARNMFSDLVTFAPHLYFNGAGGNITAGKYNDGEKKVRYELAVKLFNGLKEAWENTKKEPVDSFDYTHNLLHLPMDERFCLSECVRILGDQSSDTNDVQRASRKLAWDMWYEKHPGIDVSVLSINKTKVLHMPGELFVEYQLYAKQKYPQFNICMAAYGEYGTSYIGVKQSYFEGGYETQPTVTKVSEDSEPIIKACIDELICM